MEMVPRKARSCLARLCNWYRLTENGLKHGLSTGRQAILRPVSGHIPFSLHYLENIQVMDQWVADLTYEYYLCS